MFRIGFVTCYYVINICICIENLKDMYIKVNYGCFWRKDWEG